MSEKDYKSFMIRFFVTAGCLLLLAAVFVFLFDPFFHYHGLWLGMKGVQTKEEFQVNGALEHLDYDALMLGASVTMNINTDELDEAFGCHTQKAVASGAYCSTLVYYLEKAYQYQDLRYVFWGLDPDQLLYEIEDPPIQDQILYLRDRNPFNDVNYLWNIDVIFEEIPSTATLSWKNGYDPGTAYDFTALMTAGIGEALGSYTPEGEVKEVRSVEDENYLRKRDANLDRIEELVRSHPETEFRFFFTLSSILWWDIHYRDGNYERYFDVQEEAVRRLSVYENAEIYTGVFNDEDCIMDLSHYHDYCHADGVLNQRQAGAIIRKERLLTPENVGEETDHLRRLLLDFEDRLGREGGSWDFLYDYAGCADQDS